MQTESYGMLTLDSGRWRELKSWFLGIGYDERAVVIGNDGLDAYVKANGTPGAGGFPEGRYIAVLERENHFSILTDPMGQDVLYYHSPDPLEVGGASVSKWAISNSLLSLVRASRQFGGQRLHRPGVLGFQVSAGRAMGAQLFSNHTPVQRARVLPIGCELRVSKGDGTASLHRLVPGDWLLASDGSTYAELIADYVRQSISVCSALRQSGRLDVLCDVSGGHDSRAVMGMLERSEGPIAVDYISDITKKQDYRIAKQLARHFGVKLKRSGQLPPTLDGASAFDIWAQGSAGVYLPIVPPRVGHAAQRLRFHGGNFLSKEFGEVSASEKARTLWKWIKTGRDDQMAVSDEFLSSFRSIDMDASAPFAMQMHYINFRGRFHYGRNWYSQTRSPMMTPLISQRLAKAAFRLSPEAYNRGRVSLDLLLALDNRLGAIPFDSPEKDFSAGDVSDSPFFGRVVDAGSLLPEVYGGDKAQREPYEDAGGESFLDVFSSAFPQLSDRVRGERILSDEYVEKAAAEVSASRGMVQNMRAAAHVAHVGLLLSAMD